MNSRMGKFGNSNKKYMIFSLKNKVAVITGAGSGIGKAIAEVFASQGAQVYVVDLNESAANETAQLLTGKTLLAKAFCCNVTKQAEVHSVFESIVKEFGRIDILI